MLAYEDVKAAGKLWDGQYSVIPETTREAMVEYVENRREPGGFLSAVICNNLINAVGRADKQNLLVIKEIVQWFYNVAPSCCFGSPEKMSSWLKNEAA